MDFCDLKSTNFQLSLSKTTNEEDSEDIEILVKNSDLFSENKTKLQEIFVQSSSGWTLILRCLVHPDNLTRKYALYFLKRLVDHWNLDKDLFRNYFLVLETVDEKQVHLVKQIFGHIAKLWEVQEFLPFNLVILRRLFTHQNQAIAKATLHHFLSEVFDDKCANNPCFKEFIKNSLLPSLNSSKFFDTEELFEAFCAFLSRLKDRGDLWSLVLESIFSVSWAPIPLYHCLRAIQESSDRFKGVITGFEIDLNMVKQFNDDAFKCQEPLIRGAAQENLLLSLINFNTCAKVLFKNDINELKKFTNAFFGSKRILIRGTKLFDEYCKFIKDFLNECPDEELDPVLLIMKCDLRESDILNHPLIISKIDRIKENEFRAQGPIEDIIEVATVIHSLEQPQHRKGREHLEHKKLKLTSSTLKTSSEWNEIALIMIDNINKISLEEVDKVIKTIENLVEFDCFRHKFEDLLLRLTSATLQELQFIYDFMKKSHLNNELEQEMVKIVKSKKYPKIPQSCSKGKESSLCLFYQYKILSHYHLDEISEELFETCYEDIQSAGLYASPAIIDIASKLKLEDLSKIECEFIPSAKNAVFDLRKNDQFWPAFGSYVKVLFSPKNSTDFLIEASKDIFTESETVPGLALVMVNFVKSQFNEYSKEFIINFSSDCLTFGPIFKKEQTLLNSVNEFIFNKDYAVNIIEGSDHLVNIQVRAKSVEMLMLNTFSSGDLQTLVKTLKANEDTFINGKKRYFDNSAIHLLKQRTCQAILLIVQFKINDPKDEVLKDILEIALENIEAQSQQLSIRYFYEWILVVLCLKNKDLVLPKIKAGLEKAKVSRLGIVPAYLCIYCHQVNTNSEQEIDEALELLAPWCLGQKFITRTMANSCFRRLFKEAETYPKIQEKYSLFEKCINEALNQGDKAKNEEIMNSDFYLTDFDPKANLNLDDIFHHFPRLLNVNDLIKGSVWSFEMKDFRIENSSLRKLKNNSVSNTIKNLGINANDEAETGQVQKKIIPWNQMFDLQQESKKEPRHLDLIMVASLIDRAPNLGGLSRTCEIFGAGKLVLNNKKIIEEKDFLNTSVTAHQWIDIEEVKIDALEDYLKTMKGKGYTIIGIEQTSKSQKLHEFKFPAKSLILLGNEKEGIPVEMIQLLDVCVEIPQSGLIRSLNVHVTGAIIVWEYVRQNL